jgi:hypothetical protein
MKKKSLDTEEVKTVLIKRHSGEYHLSSEFYLAHQIEIPEDLWLDYVNKRTEYLNARQQLDILYDPPKDKPMRISKYH